MEHANEMVTHNAQQLENELTGVLAASNSGNQTEIAKEIANLKTYFEKQMQAAQAQIDRSQGESKSQLENTNS